MSGGHGAIEGSNKRVALLTDYQVTRANTGELTWQVPGVLADGTVPTWGDVSTFANGDCLAVGAAGQLVKLSLSDGTATDGVGEAASDYSPNLQYWDGDSWESYTANSFVSIPADGDTLQVRVAIVADSMRLAGKTLNMAVLGASPWQGRWRGNVAGSRAERRWAAR